MCTKSALALLFGERRDTEPAGEVQEGERRDTEPVGEVQESEYDSTFIWRFFLYLANRLGVVYRFIWKWLIFPTTCLASLL